uniref:RPOL4c domain-containing protein n=1 Tax=Steinernema glaseri TaxID=37863 RepID=A0A1I7YCN6_9BILA
MTSVVRPGGGISSTEENFEENAVELKFPKVINSRDCDVLMTSEVFLLLEHRRQQSEAKEDIEEMSEVFVKTLDYTRRFSKFKSRESIRAVRAIFIDKPFLHKFELTQITNLCPETAEEAKALIPSLEGKIADEELDEMLRELAAKKTFQ